MITHDFSQSSQTDPEIIAKRLQTLEAKSPVVAIVMDGASINEPAIDKRLNAATGVAVFNTSAGASPDVALINTRLKAKGV